MTYCFLLQEHAQQQDNLKAEPVAEYLIPPPAPQAAVPQFSKSRGGATLKKHKIR